MTLSEVDFSEVNNVGTCCHKMRKRYTGYAVIKKRKGKRVISFQFTPWSDIPFLLTYSEKIVEFIERLRPDVLEDPNVFALDWDEWQRSIVFAISSKFIRDRKKLNQFSDFILEMNSTDLIYWYDHIARSIDYRERRNRVAKAMLILYEFL